MPLSPAERAPLRPSCTRMLPGVAEPTAADVPGGSRCEWSVGEGLPDVNDVQLRSWFERLTGLMQAGRSAS